jgi:hypothetical protein
MAPTVEAVGLRKQFGKTVGRLMAWTHRRSGAWQDHVHPRRRPKRPVRLSIRGGISSLSFDGEQFGSIGRGIRHLKAGWAEATVASRSRSRGANHQDVTR